jgi:hypothetical protein
MKKFSMNDFIFKLFERRNKTINLVVKMIIFSLLIAYMAYFVKFGFDFSETSIYIPFKTILYGLLFAALMIILFFIAHFSGGVDFNLKPVGLLIGLAVGGTSVGIIAGLSQSFLGWVAGGFAGIIIIALSIKFYLRGNRK